MWRWLRATLLGAAELLVSAVVHLSYGFYIFGAAVAADVAVSLVKGLIGCSGDDGSVAVGSVVEDDGAVPPIVLVHGIFGFGKGVRARPTL